MGILFAVSKNHKRKILHAKLMNALGAHIVILRPRHESFTQALVHHKDHLGSHLRTQERRLLSPNVLPLREILGQSSKLDTRRGLSVTGMLMMGLLLLLLLILLHLELCLQMLCLTWRSETVRIRSRRGSEKERVDSGAVMGVGKVGDGLRGIGSGSDGSGEV